MAAARITFIMLLDSLEPEQGATFRQHLGEGELVLSRTVWEGLGRPGTVEVDVSGRSE